MIEIHKDQTNLINGLTENVRIRQLEHVVSATWVRAYRELVVVQTAAYPIVMLDIKPGLTVMTQVSSCQKQDIFFELINPNLVNRPSCFFCVLGQVYAPNRWGLAGIGLYIWAIIKRDFVDTLVVNKSLSCRSNFMQLLDGRFNLECVLVSLPSKSGL